VTPFDRFLQMLATLAPELTIWLLVKLLFLVGLGIYIFFAAIIIRQVGLMNRTLKGTLDVGVRLLAWMHFLAVIFIFILALVIL